MDAATLAALSARVTARLLDDEAAPTQTAVDEMISSAFDRVSIRLAPYPVPEAALTIVVEVAVKALRLRGYEGSTAESMGDGGNVSNTFVDDVLAAYENDLAALRRNLTHTGATAGIRFF